MPVLDPLDRAGIMDAIARRLYPEQYAPTGTPIFAVEVRTQALDEDGNPGAGLPVVVMSGLAQVWREDDAEDTPLDLTDPHVSDAAPRVSPRLRLHWVDREDGTSFRMAVDTGGPTLSAEQVAELRGLADFNPLDEWAGSDRFEELAAAVLRMVGGRA